MMMDLLKVVDARETECVCVYERSSVNELENFSLHLNVNTSSLFSFAFARKKTNNFPSSAGSSQEIFSFLLSFEGKFSQFF